MDKRLTIQVDAKISPQVAQLKRMFDQFGESAGRMSKAFQGIQGTSGAQPFMQGSLAKSLLQEKKLFDDLGKSGSQVAKILQDQVSRAHTNLKKEVEATAKALERAVEKTKPEYWKKHGVTGPLAERMMGSAGAEVTSATAQHQSMKQAMQALVGGGGGSALRQLIAPLIPAISTIAVAGALTAAPGAALAYRTAGMGQYAAQGQAAMAGYGGAAGSLSHAYAMSRTLSDPGRGTNEFLAYQSGNLGTWAHRILGLPQVLWNPRAYAQSWGKSASEEGRASMLEYQSEMASMRQQADPYTTKLLDAQQGVAGRHTRAMRRFGASPDELKALHGTYFKLGDMSQTEAESHLDTLRGFVGIRAAKGDAHPVRAASAIKVGMDAGTVGQMRAAEMLAGGSLLNRGTATDLAIQNFVGAAVARQALDPTNMLMTGEGLQAKLLSGVSPTGDRADDMRKAQQNMAGMGMGERLAAGHTPYKQARNMVEALGIVGRENPGAASVLSTLPQSVVTEIMAAGPGQPLPAQLRGVGLTFEHIKQRSGNTAKSLFENALLMRGGNEDMTSLITTLNSMDPEQRNKELGLLTDERRGMLAGALQPGNKSFSAVEIEGFLRGEAATGTKAALAVGEGGDREDAAKDSAARGTLVATLEVEEQQLRRVISARDAEYKIIVEATLQVAKALGQLQAETARLPDPQNPQPVAVPGGRGGSGVGETSRSRAFNGKTN